MLGLGSKKAGLTIEQNGVRFIQLKNNKTWEIEKQSFLPLDPGTIIENQIADEEKLRSQIRQWAEQEGLKGSRVALSVPPSQVIIRKMGIPAVQPKQVQQLVALEVETGLHLPFEEPVYDFIPIGRDMQIQDEGFEEEVTRVLVFAAPRKLIAEYVEILDEAGIKTESVEVSATALGRMAEIARGQSFADTMLVHLEHSQLDVYMFREGQPVFMRTINLLDIVEEAPLFESQSYLDQKTALRDDRLSGEQVLEITAEISRMLNFYQYSLHDGAARITELVVTGTEASRGQLVNELRQALAEIDIQELELESSPGKVADASLNLYRVAVGAALRDDKNSLIDLMPREDREARVLPYALGALLLIWILAVGGVAAFYFAQKSDLAGQSEQIDRLIADSQVKQLELAGLQGSGGSPEVLIRQLEASRMDAVSVLEQLDAALPDRGVIRNISYSQNSTVDLTVDVGTINDASVYLANLKKLPFVSGASISSLAEETDTGSGSTLASTGLYAAVYSISTGTQAGGSDAAADSVQAIGGAIAPDAASSDLTTQEESVNDGTNP
ncbi:pilus assembly protein PilM [Saccharibacillus alkalitolerans]|uniref:Pilus assembly protein PilM n=1 Tax=Saccharibacillus alkalitolerans TaxID=2705290 RepID=A0ABX0F852_9BACL|nr:pilus assembly protein PilM [Saccharibacillus alkalitolerans]NGZ76080.1 pilus assembly protein PilM [Saccharibacillus alkalitolerans]